MPRGAERCLAGVQLSRVPLGMIEPVSSKLKPNFVFVATAMKASLFFFEIVDVNPEFLACVKHGRLRPAFSRHAGKIVESSDLFAQARTFHHRANQRGGVALDPNIGLRLPESDVLE